MIEESGYLRAVEYRRLRTRDAGRRPGDGLEPLRCDLTPAHVTNPVCPFGNSDQCGVYCRQLVNDLIVNGNVGESLDGDARALTDPLAERYATARHVRTRSKRGRTFFEIVTQRFECRNQLVQPSPFIIGIGSRCSTHAVDSTTHGEALSSVRARDGRWSAD